MATAAARTGIPQRLIVVVMCFVATAVCYVDRVNISVAVIPMAERFHWSATTKGAVLTSFFVGYMAAMLPCGWLAARFGGRRVLGLALVGWSLATLATPAAAFAGLPALLAVRGLMGTAEAATFPAAIGLFARWLPLAERSRAVALNLGGIPVGTVAGLSAAGALIAAAGWPAMFAVFGVAGLGVAALWFAVVRDGPRPHPRLDAATAAPPAAVVAVPWRRLLREPACRAIVVNHFASNWVLYLMLTWLPSYLHDVQHLDVGKAGLAAVLPWVSLFVAGNAAGHLADALVAPRRRAADGAQGDAGDGARRQRRRAAPRRARDRRDGGGRDAVRRARRAGAGLGRLCEQPPRHRPAPRGAALCPDQHRRNAAGDRRRLRHRRAGRRDRRLRRDVRPRRRRQPRRGARLADLGRAPTASSTDHSAASRSAAGAGRGPRTSRPGRAPVATPSRKVTTPDLIVQA